MENKINAALKTIFGVNVVLILLFAGAWAWRNRVAYIPGTTLYEGIFGQESRVKLKLERWGKVPTISSCRKEEEIFLAGVRRTLKLAGLEADQSSPVELSLLTMCGDSGGMSIDDMVVEVNGEKTRLETSTEFWGLRLLEMLYRAKGQSVMLAALREKEYQCDALRILDASGDVSAAGGVAEAIEADQKAFEYDYGCRGEVSDYLAKALRANDTKANVDRLLPALLAGLGRGGMENREAVVVLGDLKDPRAIPRLMIMYGFINWPLGDCDAHIPAALDKIDSAWRFNPEVRRQLPDWIKKLKSEDFQEKRDALAVVSLAGGDEVVPHILEVMNGPEFPYQFGDSVKALGHTRSVLAVQPLIDAFDKAGSGGAEAVAAALRELTAQDLGAGKKSWEDWWAANKGAHGVK